MTTRTMTTSATAANTPAEHSTIVPRSAPSVPRVVLVPARAGQAVLDGGWWPRSWNPVAELPGLILALDDRFGLIGQVLLNSDAWDSHFRRLSVGGRVVEMGWFSRLDAAVAVAITVDGSQLDLLVVPPQTPETTATRAMAQAADPTNIAHAPALLAALPATEVPAPRTGADPAAG